MQGRRLRREPLALPFLGLLLVLALGSAQYANNLGFLFTFWLAALAAGGLTGLRARLAGVSARTVQAESGFEGEPLHLTLELASEQPCTVRLGFGHADGTAPTPTDSSGSGAPHEQPLRLVPGEPRVLRLPLPPRGRGAHIPGPLHLTLRDRLGLVRLDDARMPGGRHWVYPAPRGERPLPPPEGLAARAGQEDFEGLRRYRPGDAPARIHWASLARGSDLQTRQFGGDAAPHGPRVLDEALLADLPREERLGQLCAWLLDCEARNEPYALRLREGASIPLGLGPEHRLRGLRLLAEAPRA